MNCGSASNQLFNYFNHSKKISKLCCQIYQNLKLFVCRMVKELGIKKKECQQNHLWEAQNAAKILQKFYQVPLQGTWTRSFSLKRKISKKMILRHSQGTQGVVKKQSCLLQLPELNLINFRNTPWHRGWTEVDCTKVLKRGEIILTIGCMAMYCLTVVKIAQQVVGTLWPPCRYNQIITQGNRMFMWFT